MTAPATTKNTTSGMGLPGMRLARNDEHTTSASIVASIVSCSAMRPPCVVTIEAVPNCHL